MARRRWVYLSLAMILIFLLLAVAIQRPEVQDADLLILAVLMYMRTSTATAFFRFITFFGTATFFYPATGFLGIAFYTWRRWRGFLGVMLAMIIANIIMEGLKGYYHRPRPTLGPIETVPGYSFPSGHAMLGTLFFGLLALWLLKVCPARYRPGVIPATVLFLALLGFSRLYLGVHYPTDVLAGYAAGTACLALYLAWWEKK